MKVKKLAEAQKEYNRLQSLIDKIEDVLEKFDEANNPPEDKAPEGFFNLGTVTFTISYCNDDSPIKQTDIKIPSQVANLIQNDVVDLLKVQLGDAKKAQDALEV